MQGKKPWPRSLSESCIMNAATKETIECSTHDWILLGQNLHCQIVNIILTPEDTMIQSSNNKQRTPTRCQMVLPLVVLLQPGKIYCIQGLSL